MKTRLTENYSQNTDRRIYVGGLVGELASIQDKDLRILFGPHGDVEVVDIHRDTDLITKESRGYAFIQFSTVDDTLQAIKEMNGFKINGIPIKVSSVQPHHLGMVRMQAKVNFDEENDNNYVQNAASRAVLMQKLSRQDPRRIHTNPNMPPFFISLIA